MLLSYTELKKLFYIHMYKNDNKLGALMIQWLTLITFNSLKITSPHTRYTELEKQLLRIIDILKEFKTILLGQLLRVFT